MLFRDPPASPSVNDANARTSKTQHQIFCLSGFDRSPPLLSPFLVVWPPCGNGPFCGDLLGFRHGGSSPFSPEVSEFAAPPSFSTWRGMCVKYIVTDDMG